jgi:hypothetical protein
MSWSEHKLSPPAALRIGHQRSGFAGGLDSIPEGLPGAEAVSAHAPPEAPGT